MHDTSYKSALARRACRYSDARPPRKTDGVLLESEIPPHMRGKDVQPCRFCVGIGITPAYAGKSRGRWQWTTNRRDHPRICREKAVARGRINAPGGSPPHMRGKVTCIGSHFRRLGITPACAGKRPPQSPPSGQSRDHPRICGEKLSFLGGLTDGPESPPAYAGVIPYRQACPAPAAAPRCPPPGWRPPLFRP